MPSTLPPVSQLLAPATWRSVDLISDLHLQASDAPTFALWQRYMAGTSADAVLILGDLFEVWVGDDAVSENPFLQSCAAVLQNAAQRLYLGVMHGNRDFLLGTSFVHSCHAHLLPDPTLLQWGATSWLLSHGDALCTADTAYQTFRRHVRTREWRDAFLAQPLHERQRIARELRDESEARKRVSVPSDYADAETALTLQWLNSAPALTLIHGHTHQPADHELPASATGQPRTRCVLSDWDALATPPRAQVLRLHANGQRQRIPLV